MPSPSQAVSGFVPTYNNAASVGHALGSLKAQSHALVHLWAFDDGSSDGTAHTIRQLGFLCLSAPFNHGRGYVRAKAMHDCPTPLLLSCDATVMLAPDFLAKALQHFQDPRVAAVYGRLVQLPSSKPLSSSDLWRYHHLIHQDSCPTPRGDHVLQTAGCVLRKAAVLSVGNFDPKYRKDEDRQLGLRLLKAGWKVIQDPELLIYLHHSDGVWQLLKRYCRWNAPLGRRQSLREYARQVAYALQHMAWQDLRHRRYGCVLISLLSPHVLYAYSWYSWLKSKQADQANTSCAV